MSAFFFFYVVVVVFFCLLQPAVTFWIKLVLSRKKKKGDRSLMINCALHLLSVQFFFFLSSQ